MILGSFSFGPKAITEFLRINKTLKILVCCKNNFGSDDAVIMADGLGDNLSLIYLNLEFQIRVFLEFYLEF